MLAGWKGSGGDAYREHLGKIGKQIEDLITDATNVSGALTRIEGDIRKSVSTIPIPLMDDFGFNEWSLPNGTELDDARDGESSSGFLAALRKDYQSNPGSYADGAFRDKADDLEATMKVDGQAGDQKRGGWWDTKAHLDNWYRDNQQAANTAMSPLPAGGVHRASQADRERPEATRRSTTSAATPGCRHTGRPDIGGGEFGGKPDIGGGGPTIGSRPPGIGDTGGPTSSSRPVLPDQARWARRWLAHRRHRPAHGPIHRLRLPGHGDAGLQQRSGRCQPGRRRRPGRWRRRRRGRQRRSRWRRRRFRRRGRAWARPAGSAPAVAWAVGRGIGVGGIPGMVGGGNGKLPPMTSAANALRTAAGAGAGGAGMAGGARGAGVGGAGMMGGGMMGGAGGAGHGGGAGSEHSSWLTEDDDPWGAGDGASPGILR